MLRPTMLRYVVLACCDRLARAQVEKKVLRDPQHIKRGQKKYEQEIQDAFHSASNTVLHFQKIPVANGATLCGISGKEDNLLFSGNFHANCLRF